MGNGMSEHTCIDAPNAADAQTATVAQQTLTEYLNALRAIRVTGAGVAETSYYPALSSLFNAVGKTLKPKVGCVMNLKNLGAGMPDGGWFTVDQFQRQAQRPRHCRNRVRDSLCGHRRWGPPQPVVFGLFVLAEPFTSQCQNRLRPFHVPELLRALHPLAKQLHP